ncbi:MAG: Rpn family recombination-promoting nuclease/putative transposase [Myxococcaceae bacterium]|nr:Rpn family recombination-promoting nuclease/putative transposase [Myxococcaceae bacterium]MBH2006454.1 Rpn family recombination-promoting nuclease/putative transposase [Myxococcaceae bacterium]
MQRYLDPTNDVGFKKVFSDPIRMMDFLNSILRLPAGKKIQQVDFVPTEQIPDLGQGKRSLFDLKCQDESGTYFLIEMQCRRSPTFLKRMQYYGAHAYTSQIQTGKKHARCSEIVT